MGLSSGGRTGDHVDQRRRGDHDVRCEPFVGAGGEVLRDKADRFGERMRRTTRAEGEQEGGGGARWRRKEKSLRSSCSEAPLWSSGVESRGGSLCYRDRCERAAGVVLQPECVAGVDAPPGSVTRGGRLGQTGEKLPGGAGEGIRTASCGGIRHCCVVRGSS